MNRKTSGTIFAATCLSAAVALFLCGAASAQMGRTGGYASGPSPSSSSYPSDNSLGQLPNSANALSAADFAKEATEGGLAVMKFGQLAQDRGSSDTVKEFGKKMMADRAQLNEMLKTLASQKDLKLPTDLNKHDQKDYDKLSQMSGEAFDKAYMKDAVRVDQDQVYMFQQEASSGQDAAVKEFAARILPNLQEQLKSAKETSKTVSSEKRKSASN